MHARAKKRVKLVEIAICPEHTGCSHCHVLASDALAAGDTVIRNILDRFAGPLELTDTRSNESRLRGRQDVIDAIRLFLVPE